MIRNPRIKQQFLTFCFLFISFFSKGQYPIADFSYSGGACPGQVTNFTNNSSNSSQYLWDFCAGDFSTLPSAADFSFTTPNPTGMTTVFDGANWFGFVVNSSLPAITRYDFGPSLSNNNPTPVVLTIPAGFLFAPIINNISIVQEGGGWVGIIANFSSNSNLVKLDFGASLSNPAPTPSLLTAQHLNACIYQTLVVDSGNIYIFFCNYGDNNLVVANFGNSINNAPAFSFVPIPSVPAGGNLSDIAFVRVQNTWYGYMTALNNSLIKLVFGSSLSNSTPITTTVAIPGLAVPVSIVLDNDGEGWYGFIQNNDAGILKLSFGTDINNAPFTTTLSLPSVTGIAKKLALAKEASDHYLFGTGGATNHIAKIKFARPCSASPQVSIATTPTVTYGIGGTYYIGLMASDTLGNVDYHYDSIVHPLLLPNFSFDHTLLGDTTVFTDLSTISMGTIVSWSWDFGDSSTDTNQNPKHLYASTGDYDVTLITLDSNGCSNSITISLTIIPKLTADFLSPDTLCAAEVIPVTNISANASGFLWDFCAGDFSTNPSASDYSVPTTNSIGLTTVFDGINWHGFMVNGTTAQITRFDFGTSLSSNNPTPVVLTIPAGYLIPPMINNISIVQEGGNWVGIIANFSSNSNLVRLDFGASLTNVAPAPSLISAQHLNSSLYQTLVADNGNLFLFFCNYSDNKLVVASFGNSITNTPVFSFIQIPSVPVSGGLSDIAFVKVQNRWRGFMTSLNNTLIKLDFGSSLSNTSPVISTVTVPGLAVPVSIVMDNDGQGWYGFIQNNDAGILKLSFGSDINNTPVTTLLALPALAGIAKKLTLTRDESDHYLFGTGGTNDRFSKIKFARPCSATPPVSNGASPVASYSTNGSYFIGLTATDVYGNLDFHLDSVEVKIAPVPDFSFANTCLGDLTEFYDSTTIEFPATVLFRTWDFGDSSLMSTLQNPTHIYSAAGDYTVRLVSHGSTGCTDTMSKVIHINHSPSTNFISVTGCSDLPLQFFDSSSIVSGTIVSWQWDFGDGLGTSIDEDPIYTYPDGGNYTVTLEVTSDSGCTDIQTQPVAIKSAPDGNFEATNTCIGQTVQFINQTLSDTTILGYQWDFGDSTTDTAQHPSHVYPAVVASYPVTYIVNATNGCSDTVVTQLKINNIPVADFSVAPVNICEGNATQFTDLSTVTGDTISKWLWSFGDGFTDTVADPVHVYADSGTYTVSLIAYAATSCGSSTSKTVTVLESPVAWFGFTPVCLGITSVFSDSTIIPAGSIITQYHWDFGDGDSSTLQNPAHDFVTAGSHTVTLTVETNFGCMHQVSRLVTVHPKPVASFNFTNPCSHYPVDFNSTSSVPIPYTISTYQWNFGDPASGTNNTSALPTPSHSFDTTFSYPVTLIVSTDAGCLDTTFHVLVIKQSSIVNFQYSPTCRGDYTDFANLSTPPIDTAWFWEFGDGQFSILREPAHYYISAGQYQVTLTATAGNGCVSEATKTVTVSPIPVADFVNTPICIGVPFQFQDNSSIAAGSALATWKWVVSGLDSSNLQNPVFTFPDTGTYLVTLTVTSTDSCKKSVTKTVRVYPLPVANFVFNPQYGNPPLLVNYSNLTTGASTYQWDFGNGVQSTLMNPTNTYLDTGQYFIELVSRSSVGCYDTAIKSIYVIKPLLDLAIRNIYSYILDNHLYLSAEVINLGTRDVNSFNISADVDNGHSIRETYTGFLPNGSQGILLYEFNASFELTPGQEIHYFCIRVSEPNGEADNAPANDEKCNSLESGFSIKDPYPNPFTSTLSLEIILPYSDLLTVELFELSGKKVRDLYNGQASKGLTSLEADLQGLSAGVYALKCTFRDQVLVRSVMKTNKRK